MARILVVDDSSSVRVTLEYCLQSAGHDVVLADGGSAGYRRACEGGIDLVLADVNMPGMDGVELCRALRSARAAACSPPPVLLMTGCPTSETLGHARVAGARGVLSKPFVIAELIETVNRHLATADC